MAHIHDRLMLDILDRQPLVGLHERSYRVTWASRDPLMGSSSGGRWSPNGGFEVLYTSLENNGGMAEAYFHLSRAPVISSSQMKLNIIELALDKVIHLTDEVLGELSVEDPRAHSAELDVTQAIGSAARLIGAEAIRVPSARWPCDNVLIFLDAIDLNRQVTVREQLDINWPAWNETVRSAQKS